CGGKTNASGNDETPRVGERPGARSTFCRLVSIMNEPPPRGAEMVQFTPGKLMTLISWRRLMLQDSRETPRRPCIGTAERRPCLTIRPARDLPPRRLAAKGKNSTDFHGLRHGLHGM